MSVFGFSTEPNKGGDFLPIVKYDARAGRIFRMDRVDAGGQFVTEPVDITTGFKAMVDLENIETGWVNFNTGGAPHFAMVRMGERLPAQPSPQHKNAVRFMMKLGAECGGEKRIREMASQAKAFLSGFETLYHDYLAQKDANPGKLPVVTLKTTKPIKSGQGDKQSTNYLPVFEIVGWSPRGDLAFQPKGDGGAPPAETAPAAAAQTPPATGSTVVAPPAAKPAPAPAMADDEDFG